MGEITVPMIRTLSALMSRIRSAGGTMFGGKRNFSEALGYLDQITVEQHRQRYERGDIAGRIVDAAPKATWGGEPEIIEVEDAEVTTKFEEAVAELMTQVKMWSIFKRTDILAGLGKYAIYCIGAPGTDLSQELPKGKPGQIAYLAPYGEDTAKIAKYEENDKDERWGLPTMYELSSFDATGKSTTSKGRQVHWTRIIHVADNILDNELAGYPRLARVWNRLDDLEKLVGGGSEAFWKTVFQGMQLDVDKDMELDDPNLEELKKQIDEFEHNMRRTMRTRGVKVTTLGADTSDFSANAATLLDLISGAAEIPQRILLGSERGELASTQDRENWHDRIENRRLEYAEPYFVRPLIDRLIEYGYLPKPKDKYWVVWPKLGLTLAEKSTIVARLGRVNTYMGETVVTPADLRDKVLGWDQLAPEDVKGPDPAVDTDDPNVGDANGQPIPEGDNPTDVWEADGAY